MPKEMAVRLSQRAKWQRLRQRAVAVMAWVLVLVGADAAIIGVFLPDVKLALLGLMAALLGLRNVGD